MSLRNDGKHRARSLRQSSPPKSKDKERKGFVASPSAFSIAKVVLSVLLSIGAHDKRGTHPPTLAEATFHAAGAIDLPLNRGCAFGDGGRRTAAFVCSRATPHFEPRRFSPQGSSIARERDGASTDRRQPRPRPQPRTAKAEERRGGGRTGDVSSPARRSVAQQILAPGLLFLSAPIVALAMDGTERIETAFSRPEAGTATDGGGGRIVLLRGVATLSPSVSEPSPRALSDSSALYVTARPDRVDNVPRAILDGSRGKSPPVLVARFTNVDSFPFQFELTSEDVTAEGLGLAQAGTSAAEHTAKTAGRQSYWWSDDDLVVSARLDSDGVAATRDPDDLVGRGFRSKLGKGSSGGGGETVEVQLQGRGIGGKFVTGKAKK